MAILIKTAAEIEMMRSSGEALRQEHEAVRPHVQPGASTMDLEKIATAKMEELRAISAFKGYRGFPAVLCTSINNEVVHGFPSPTRILTDGDIVSIDCGVIVDGFDFFAVYEAAGVAIARARQGRGPSLLEVKFMRYFGHFEGDAQSYRAKDEVKHLRETRDCLKRFAERVTASGTIAATPSSVAFSTMKSIF